MKNPLLALVLTFGLIINALGQEPQPKPAPSPQPTPPSTPAPTPDTQEDADDVVKITTKLVQVDATVIDRDGKQVTTLTADDFEITENGRPQKITNFSYISSAPGPAASGTPATSTTPKDKTTLTPAPVRELRPEEVRRAIALVVDDLRMSAEGISSTRQALRKYVDQQMQPGDLVAIIRTSAGIGSLQQFTNDRHQLYAAIERVRQIARVGGRVGAFTSVNMLDRLETQVTESLSLSNETETTANTRRREGAISAASQSSMPGVEGERLVGVNLFRDTLVTVGTVGALNFVVRGLRELPGRKAVVLFSDGISIFNSDSNTGDRNERTLTALRQLVESANRASVVFYAIDTRGLQPSGFQAADNTTGGAIAPGNSGPSGSITGIGNISSDLAGREVFGNRSGEMFEGQNGLNFLATQTGGMAVFNNNDLNRGIRRALDDIVGFYLIGYRPDDSTFDTTTGRRNFNTWSIKVKNQPGFKVRTRTGFVGIADAPSRAGNRTRSEQLMAALLSPFAADGINLQLSSFFLNDATLGSTMRSVLLLDAGKLSFAEQPDGRLETTLDIAGVTLGDSGQILDQVIRIEKIRVSRETHQRFLREGMAYGVNVPVAKPGAYLLRIAVRDAATGRIGSAGQYIEVPNVNSKDQLILSSLVISGNNPDGIAKRQTPAERLRALLTTINSSSAAASTSTASSSTPIIVAGGEGMIGTEDPRAGPASRRFRPRMYLNFACVIYKRKGDKAKQLQLSTQVRIFRDGQEVFTGQSVPLDMSQQQDLTRLVVARRLFLGTVLGPGDYILHLTVTDASSGRPRTAARWLDFTIAE